MKKTLFLLWIFLAAGLHLYAQQDSLKASRYVMRSTMIGAGFTNVFDTYLSPLEYKGVEGRFIHESMRMTKLMHGHVSGQNLVQVYGSYTENLAQNADMYTAMLRWSYALHYQFQLNPSLKLLAGPYIDLNGGVIYNRRNSNNPAQGKGYGGLGISGMAIYKFNLGRFPFTLRYQAQLPLLGIMFSPEYGESYYEIFSLQNGGRNVLFTSLHNQPTLHQMLTLDFPIRNTVMRVGYICDIQQAKVNHLKTHIYSHDFMLGFVRNIYLIRGKNRISMPAKVTPF